MKAIAAGLVALGLGAGAALADPIEGMWQTQVDDGAYAHVKMVPCGANFCGTMVRTFNSEGEYKSPNIGKPFVIDMTPQGNGSYQGQVWRPSNDKIYTGKAEVNGNRMELKGCVAGGLICSGQTWARLQ